MAKVSLIIPAYNAEDYIERCIESVCGQSERDIQIVVVNDGSTDRTKDIVEQLAKKDKRITLINQDNHGPVYSRKKGLEVSKAEYLLFVDADDWIAEYTVEELYEIAQRDCVDLVVPGMIYAFDKKEEHHRLERNYYSGMQFLEALLEERVPHNTASCLYKKSVFVDIPWEQCEKLFMGDDLVLSIFVASHGISAETLNREYYYYYQNADSMTHVAYEKIVKIYDALEVIRLYLQKQGLADKYQQQIDFLFYLHGIHYHGIMPFQRNLGVRKQLALRWKSLGINIYENPCYQDFVKRQPLSKRIFMKSYQYSFYLNYVLGVIIMPVFNCLKGR